MIVTNSAPSSCCAGESFWAVMKPRSDALGSGEAKEELFCQSISGLDKADEDLEWPVQGLGLENQGVRDSREG